MSSLAKSKFFDGLARAGAPINPSLLKLLSGVGVSAGSPASPLDAALAAIPVADDGLLITPDYHNTLLAALVILASQSGTPAPRSVTLTYAPTFVPPPPGVTD